MMRAKQVWVERPGGTEVLTLREMDLPPLQPNAVYIEVEASGITQSDILSRRGRQHPGSTPVPLVLGFEIAGTIVQVGTDVTGLTVGQRVIGVVASGGYSSHCAIESWRCIPLPDGVNSNPAVALCVNYWTAWHLLHRAANVKPRQRMLIHGAGGGVGTALAQLGHLAGLEMYGTASRAKHDQVRALHVTPIDYRDDDFVARIAEWTQGRGVDLVIDPIGGDNWMRSYRTLAKGGRLLMTGILSLGDKPNRMVLPSALQMVFRGLLPDGKSVRFVGLRPETMKDSYREDLTTLVTYLAEGKIDPIISQIFALSDVAEAHRFLESGAATGKVLLTPD